ncbi:hypothetical protein RhiLY_11878 [Ceratobasidium sp. AG-Ba]|nr:hypothetical protein RhiLY_11878 [Ceratobasidium sp. AG-Ba]
MSQRLDSEGPARKHGSQRKVQLGTRKTGRATVTDVMEQIPKSGRRQFKLTADDMAAKLAIQRTNPPFRPRLAIEDGSIHLLPLILILN